MKKISLIIINTLILFVLIKMFGQISGAHFNPAVSLVFYIRKELEQKDFAIYVIVQIIGGLIGVFLTHYIFNIQIIQVSQNIRGEIPLFVSEIIATCGLILTILIPGAESVLTVSVKLLSG